MTNQIVRRAAAIVLLLAAGCTSTREVGLADPDSGLDSG